MSEARKKVLGWGTLIAIMIGVAMVSGLALGLMSRFLGLSTNWAGGGIGRASGAVGAILVAQRRAAINQQKNNR